MGSDSWVDKGLPERLELGQRAFFVGIHQAALRSVRRQNSCQSPFYMLAAGALVSQRSADIMWGTLDSRYKYDNQRQIDGYAK